MTGLMIRSNDFHSPRSFEYTSLILNLQVSQARQWGLLVPLNTLECVIIKKKGKSYEFEMQ